MLTKASIQYAYAIVLKFVVCMIFFVRLRLFDHFVKYYIEI